MSDAHSKSNKKDTSKKGEYIRPESGFRHRITADGSSGFKAEQGINDIAACSLLNCCNFDQPTPLSRNLGIPRGRGFRVDYNILSCTVSFSRKNLFFKI